MRHPLPAYYVLQAQVCEKANFAVEGLAPGLQLSPARGSLLAITAFTVGAVPYARSMGSTCLTETAHPPVPR